MASIQAQLEPLYCPPLDSALVAAIASDPGQTLQGAKEVLDALAADISTANDNGVGPSSPPRSVSPPTSSLQRLDLTATKRAASPAPSSPAPRSGSTSNGNGTQWSTLTTPDDGDAHSDDTGAVDRLLDEFRLAEKLDRHGKGQPLQLTDDEEGGDGDDHDDDEWRGNGTGSPPRIDDDEHGNHANRNGNGNGNGHHAQDTPAHPDPLLFLMHAFPTRTRVFLAETLHDCQDDVAICIDTLMAIDLVEREEMDITLRREAGAGGVSPDADADAMTKPKGLDYEQLAQGSGTANRYKGKRGRAMRKKAHAEYLRSIGQDGGGPGAKDQPTRVVIGDVRQGGGVLRGPKAAARTDTAAAPQPPPTPLTDAELAQRLAQEEERARDPHAGEAVRDNQWLLTSSVLAQLGTLLDLPNESATSAYNKAGFNLHVAVRRLVDGSASRYPSLESLESQLQAGTEAVHDAHALAHSLATLSGKPLSSAALALRATHGRQDAALDLLALLDVVADAAAGEKPDELDPLGKLRGSLGEDAARARSALSAQQGLTVAGAGDAAPTPALAARLAREQRTAAQGGFLAAAGRGRNAAGDRALPAGRDAAMASLRSGAAVVSFPPSAGQVSASGAAGVPLPSGSSLASGAGSGSASASPSPYASLSQVQREDLIAHFHALAADYRARRDRCLLQASRTWRTSPQNTNNRGAAFYYADEARSLDAKARMCNLRAAQCLVENRRRAGESYAPARAAAGTGRAAGVIDLHGLTVREALSIVSEELARFSAGSGAGAGSLTIITGAGRHSAGGVAVLTPSVAKYLQREGWRADVDRQRGVIVVRGGR